MNELRSKLATLTRLLRGGDIKGLARLARQQLWSRQDYFGLRRDLTIPFTPPEAKIPLLGVRPLRDDDLPDLLALDANGTPVDPEGHKIQSGLVQARIATCFVAVTDNDRPCYMQWLIGPNENRKVQSYFKGLFAPIGPDEFLFEGAYVPLHFRGQRINSRAMALIAERGVELGARWAITFIGVENVPSIRGARGAGFEPYLLRLERWRFFRRSVTFKPLPPEMAP